jgi:hypothetical protein
MAQSCTFRNLIRTINDDGKIETKLQKCNFRYNLKQIEFRHPDYPELYEYHYLCDSHYSEVFGEMKNEEDKAYREWQNAKFHYNRDYAKAQSIMEYWNAGDFKIMNYPKVENSKKKFDIIKRGCCRYESCLVRLDTVRKIYRIIVSRVGGIDFKPFYFCGKEHYEKMKQRIVPKIETPKLKVKSLLEYSE